jgi:hypothetical protein
MQRLVALTYDTTIALYAPLLTPKRVTIVVLQFGIKTGPHKLAITGFTKMSIENIIDNQ